MMRLLERITIASGSLLVVATLGCSSSSQEVELLPQSLSSVPLPTIDETIAEGSEPAATASAVAEIPDALPTPPVDDENAADASLVVIVDGRPPGQRAPIRSQPRSETQDPSLVVVVDGTALGQRAVTPNRLREASRQESQRRSATRPVAVITDKNLKESGLGGHLTIADPPKPVASTAPTTTSPTTTAPGASGLDEEYWRARALGIRLSWKEAVDTVITLESDVGLLRQRFYAEDDPVYRDREIKPAWDRALDDLTAARVHAADFNKRLELFLDEGRRGGALPGWLREGVEYQPVPEKTKARDWPDINEPQIVNEVLEP